MATTEAYGSLATTFVSDNPRSKSIHETATDNLPGGNTRSVLFYQPYPLAITKASGSQLYDADGHVYTDFLGEYTAGLFGHSEPVILDAISKAAQRGVNFGGQHEDEVRLAELIKKRFPSIDLIRYTNSGTEATLMTLALARAYTGRTKVLAFGGGYHGGAFSFAGGQSGPVNAPFPYLIGEYNNLESARRLALDPQNKSDLAVIVVEPMLGSGGAIPGDLAFLEGLRHLANETGAVLIFDEVMTSRMHQGGGIQSQLPLELRPDLTTLGKYIGGGMSFGAFGGKKAIMQLFDPRRPGALAHAGTFNNNVLTMAAGRAGLEQVFTPQRAQALHESGEKLRRELAAVGKGTLMQVTGKGSLINIHFSTTPGTSIKKPADIGTDYKAIGDVLHLYLLSKGYYIARRGFIALSLALSDEEIAGFVKAVQGFVAEYPQLLKLPAGESRL
ncbi:Aminotransferase class-III-like protein 1 [Elsinoe fawcettii]|nr:Aminotransferase class-III-like protein 1 [Elsinoe fawcettii]